MNPFAMGGPLVIPNSNLVSSFHGPFAFSLPLFSWGNIDPSNDLNHEYFMNDDAPTP